MRAYRPLCSTLRLVRSSWSFPHGCNSKPPPSQKLVVASTERRFSSAESARSEAENKESSNSSASSKHQQTKTQSTAQENFRNVVISRTAARRFSDRVVEDSIIRDIMALTLSAPTSFNLQPYSIVLVRTNEGRKRLASTMLGGNAKKVEAAPLTAVFCADLEPSKRIPRMAELYREAGMSEEQITQLIMAVNLFSGEGKVGNVIRNTVTTIASPLQPAPEVSAGETWSFKNTSMAAQTYILSCTAYGLATAAMEGFDSRRIRSALKIPDRYGIPMVVCTGYPQNAGEEGGTKDSTGPSRWRYPPHEMVFDEAFGNGLRDIHPVVP